MAKDSIEGEMMMKMICFVGVLLVLGTGLTGAQEKVKWYSIEEAIQLTSSEPRVLLVDVYTDWCGWCKRMDATTFSDPSIASVLNEHFYPVKLNAEGKEDIVIGNHTYKFVESGRSGYHEVAVIVTKGRLSYPTISYVDEKGRVLEAYPGYKTPDQLRVYLTYYADGHYKTQTFEEFAGALRENTSPAGQL